MMAWPPLWLSRDSPTASALGFCCGVPGDGVVGAAMAILLLRHSWSLTSASFTGSCRTLCKPIPARNRTVDLYDLNDRSSRFGRLLSSRHDFRLGSEAVFQDGCEAI